MLADPQAAPAAERPDQDPNARADLGGWISGPGLSVPGLDGEDADESDEDGRRQAPQRPTLAQ